MLNLFISAKEAKPLVSALTTQQKNTALLEMANALRENAKDILFANEADIKAAEGKIPKVMLDRLMLDNSRIEGMAKGTPTSECGTTPQPR